MKSILRKLGVTILVLATLFVVLRAIVVPLARQRQERRDQDPTVLSLLPADIDCWALRRGLLRFATRSLWPEGDEALERRLRDWGLPLDEILEDLGLGRLRGGGWLGGRDSGGGWLLLGPRSRLPRGGDIALALTSKPDTLITLPQGVLRARGAFVLVASSAELLDRPRWLAGLPPWSELGDLLMAGDWLEYRRCGRGGALLGVKPLFGALSCEGLAWDCAEGLELLLSLSPGPLPELAAAKASLDSLPTMRRSSPFGPEGRPLESVGEYLHEENGLQIGERRWRRGDLAASARVLRRR